MKKYSNLLALATFGFVCASCTQGLTPQTPVKDMGMVQPSSWTEAQTFSSGVMKLIQQYDLETQIKGR